MFRHLTFLLGVCALVAPLQARRDPIICGTHDRISQQEYRLHAAAARSGSKRPRASGAAAVRPDAGEIAIIDDSDGVITRRNPFGLNQRTLRFILAGNTGSYRYELTADSYDSATALGGTVLSGLGDDDSRAVSIPFAFPFFGNSYRELHVNSDGNVSFGTGDAGVTDRSLGRFLAGTPRIAALFDDLDPTQARAGGGIFVSASAGRMVVSWVQVPEYSGFGSGRSQTFQLRLFPNGTIEIAWSDVIPVEAVVGITPGGTRSDPALVSFANTVSTTEYAGGIAEFFTSNEQVDIFAAAQRFYRNHEDSYDYLVFFNNLGVQALSDAIAYEVTVRNDRTGYGDSTIDIGAEAGSKRRLQAILNMGKFSDYPLDPVAQVPARRPSPDTPRTILAHEAGHLFLAYASVRDDESANDRPMLGNASVHWSPTFNSEASLLEGERIQDNGPFTNPRFLTTGAVEGYSPLDQYLMGFRAPEEVPDTFYVAAASSTAPRFLPQVGAAFDGTRRNVTVSDIIRDVGRRTPDHTVAQRRYRFAFVLIAASGSTVPADDLARLERYRQAFEAFYAQAASGRASADVSLKRALTVTAWPAVGVGAGNSATVSVSTESATLADLVLTVRSATGATQPEAATVTIPAGRTSATFRLAGVRAGSDTLVIEPADSRYETVEFKAGVTATSGQVLRVVSGEGQVATAGAALREPVRVRLTDVNNLPYAGVSVSASTGGGGSVESGSAVTGPDGVAEFRWTPGTSGTQELRLSVPGVVPLVVTALSKPTFSRGAVVNAASFAGGIVPGGIATAFGANLGSSDPTSVQVLVNGLPAQVFFTNAGQINFLVPQSVAGTASAEIVVVNVAGRSDAVSVPVASVQPGIFFDAPTGYGAVVVAGTGQVTQVRPAARGDVVEIYATGLGLTTPASSGLALSRVEPEVLIGGIAAEVLYSGAAPGFPGLYQINARVPEGVSGGTQTMSVTMSGQRSNEVRIEVR